MSMSERSRKSPRLVLYGIAFRVLGELARKAGDGTATSAPGRQQEQRPPQPQPLVRVDADAGR